MKNITEFPGKSSFDNPKQLLSKNSQESYKLDGYAGLVIWDLDLHRAQASERISSFSSELIVPEAPTLQDAQKVIFLFNGLQTSLKNTTDKAILQPVLAWNKGGWTVSSWYVNGARDKPKEVKVICNTKPIPVTSGDKLVSVMTSEIDTYGFYYSCEFENLPGSGLELVSPFDLTLSLLALEAYGVTSCESIPPKGLRFSNVSLTTTSSRKPSWEEKTPPSGCKVFAHISTDTDTDNTEVTFSSN
ncbi:MAG: hypothetical protein P0Y58_22330 [Candidatus Pseudomonas phytovorans]|uniref:Uncharacterized protein n=1 Tax=Candidatus Pseudomonas phytovorans TaxID=3121377 RepID=A0AAJ5WET4_9PSED|nr:hypothetical protein [Pseudomonas sp.]WEK29604.1 MAG: hypothetical protein P0Y58_22330 [Pseudomonas sp.]